MSTPHTNPKGELVYESYWTCGSVAYLREGLSHDHPENLYNYLKSNAIRPEDYGIEHPLASKYKNWTREQLISHITELETAVLQTIKRVF